MAPEIRYLEQRSIREFRIQNARVRDEEKARLEALYIKQAADTKAFLEGEFPTIGSIAGDDENKDKVIVVGADHHFELYDGASKLGLVCACWRSPSVVMDLDSIGSSLRSWETREIVGRTRVAVNKKLAELKQEERRS
jgi:hypothetical protein